MGKLDEARYNQGSAEHLKIALEDVGEGDTRMNRYRPD